MPAVLAAGVCALHALQRTGFILDDWFALRDAEFGGAFHAGIIQQSSRPGEWLVYAATFGVFGRHPLAYVLVLGAIEVATSIALVVLLRSFVPEILAVAAASLWVVLPDHVSLEVWASAVNIGVAVLALVVGLHLAVRHDRSVPGALAGAALLAVAVLCYEAVGPVALVGAVVLPWMAHGRLDRRRALLRVVAVGAAGLWILLHWNPNKSPTRQTSALGQVVPAQLGWGVAPKGVWATLVLLLAVIGSLLLVLGPAARRIARRRPELRTMLLASWALLVLGALPFLKYPYGPVGAGDRANCAASLGGALIWAALLWGLWEGLADVDRRTRALGAGAACAMLLLGALTVRWSSSQRWATAFGDADRILAATVHQIPEPTGPIALGPTPIQNRNVAAFLDNSNVAAALQLAYGRRDVTGVITYSTHDFNLFPPARRVDIAPLSRLTPDVVLTPSIR